MSTIIPLTEGLQFYFANSSQQAAIDQILAQKDPPADLSWDEMEQFIDARLSAHSVQVDYWKLMKMIWQATWGNVLDLTRYREISSDRYEGEKSLEYVYDNTFYKGFEYKNCLIILSSYANLDEGVRLVFYVEDKSGGYELSNHLPLSENWDEPLDDERLTHTGILPVQGQSELDIQILVTLAQEAFAKMDKAFSLA